MTTVSVVVLTMGDRPEEFARAVTSARRQRGVEVEVVLVVNGGNPDRSRGDIVVEPGENLGIPGGRNAGAAAGKGELICFLDDDGELVDDHVLERASAVFAARDDIAVVGLGVVDEHGETSRRHHPALSRRATTGRDATSFPGGASVVRRAAFEQAGGLCAAFFYGLEETDLAWRLIDRGWAIRYEPDLRMQHPRTSPSRHPDFYRTTARNRVWLAHRLLPLPLAVLYVVNWILVTVVRNIGRWGAIRAHFEGTMAGLRQPIGPRRPLTRSAVWQLARLGRPPVV